MPTRRQRYHQGSLVYGLALALTWSACLPNLVQGQSQTQTRARRPNSAQAELDRLNEARMNDILSQDRDQDPPRAALIGNSGNRGAMLPEGTVIVTQMMTKLSSKNAQAGDRLRAKVITPVVDNYRNVLVPAGSFIEGQVQDVAPARSRRRAGMIEISFDRLRIGSDVYPIEATLAPVTAEDRKRLDSDGRLARNDNGVKRTVAFVGGGVGAGAAIGYVAGSALWGAGIGAGVGVAALLLGKGREAEVEQGMKIGAELLTPVQLNRSAGQAGTDSAYDETGRSKDYVYNDDELKERDGTVERQPARPRPVTPSGSTKGTIRAPVAGTTKPNPSATPNRTTNTTRPTTPGTGSSTPVNRADRQLVNVTNLLAERGSDDTVRVSITGQTPTAGWKLTPETSIDSGVMTIKLYGAPPQSLAAQVISSATTVIVENDPNRSIQRVTVRGATNMRTTIPISRDTRNTGGNNPAPVANPNREDLSALGLRIADKSDGLLEDYARSLRAWKTNNQYSFENPRVGGTPEAQLLYAFDRLSEAAAAFRSPLNTEAKKRALRDLVNTNAQVNRLWTQVNVAPEFKQRWQDIQNDSNRLAASIPGATAPRVINPNQPRPRG